MTSRVDQDANGRSVRQWLLLLGVALLALIALWTSTAVTSPAWRPVIAALGTGLLTSSVFTFVQTLVTARSTQRAQVRYLTAFADALAHEVRSEVTQLRDDVPTHEFPGSSEPDLAFNETIRRDVEGTSNYWFRGYSARFLAARLRTGEAPACLVKAFLPDPSQDDSLNQRISYLTSSDITSPASEVDIRKRLLAELEIGLIGLYLARHRVGSIEIVLTRTPGLDRIELLSPAVWISLFSGKNEKAEFPRTIRYNAESTVYNMLASEFLQTRNSPHNRRFEISGNTSEHEFIMMFGEMTNSPLTEKELAAKKAVFEAFEQKFSLASTQPGGRDESK